MPAKTGRKATAAKSTYHHGNLRDGALAATREIVHREGLEALTLRKVAARLGVSAPAVYHHFPSKVHLIAAAVGAAFERLDEALLRAGGSGETAAERFEAIGAAYVRFALEEPGDFRLLFGAHVVTLRLAEHECARTPGRRTKARVRTALAEALAERGSRADLQSALAIVWGQLVGIASLVAERELGPDTTVAVAEDLARRAVRSHLESGLD